MAAKSASTPETTAEQAKPLDNSPTTPAASGAPTKKQTPTQVKAELADLQTLSAARMRRIRDLEVEKQKAKDVLKDDGTPGLTLQQDHYRMKQMIEQCRKILGVVPEQITGG